HYKRGFNMLVSEKKADGTTTEHREIVIQAKNIGVSFYSEKQKDDVKSMLFSYLKEGRDPEANKKIWPLTDINFTGYKGEILGIVGSNGEGKTTLCKIISGILYPDKGEIFVDGRVSALYSFGMGFNPELSGRDNVYLN